MGGISANKPIIHLVTGPMMPGSFKGTRVGACTDCRNNWAAFRAGGLDIEDISNLNEELAPTVCVSHRIRYSHQETPTYSFLHRPAPAESWARPARWRVCSSRSG